ncbi:SDR family NAD(P)-dependent oxidoreductase [Aestuariicoccus sp. MJ-SS9]|uniref:SDR family NAD(P)-dependent oxidoreductase n=1 Tax=Aestuariicoccus sp. MJ-SS9 TaxID=3079855 RepID=UPI0029148E30|nr:SDR family NAD(P)-dependent oxidoreductase [Aestuariicoccus sp. MJ-SS9]MDU8910325.1 SDR family NAD(P)-dependent oxidoreductase [Aestuariicoccus sp. MJ-SS9]
MRVLITGVNRGIGAALDRRLSDDGHEVIGTARGHPEYLNLDVTRAEDFRALADRLDGCALDVVVCNAGVYLDKGHNLADGYPPQMWADTFAVNVAGVFQTVQTLLPNLQASAQPRVAIISSQMASSERAPGGSYIYRASKAAVLNLGRNLAVDLRPLDIAVGIYHPGWVRTDMGGSAADISDDEAAQGMAERIAALALDNTGCFETWDGRPLPF